MKKLILAIIFFFFGIVIILNIFSFKCVGEEGWTNTKVVSTESNMDAYRAILAVDQHGTVHIAWRDKTNYNDAGDDWDIFYKKKPIDGNWTRTEVVSTESNESSNCLSMSVDQHETVHVTWKDQTNYSDAGDDWDIFYKKKPIDGNWTRTEVVSTESNGSCGCPSLAVDNNINVHFTWPDGTNYSSFGGDYDIFYKMKTLNGNWTITEVVSTESTSSSLKTSVAIDPYDTIHVIWEEQTNFAGSGSDYDIFYKKKPKDENWTKTEVVSTESSTSCNWPSLAVDQNETVHIVWSDKSNLSGNDYDIFYKKKPKDRNWTETELVSTESTHNSYFTSIAVDMRRIVHVSWWDDIEGMWVVYYNYETSEDEQPLVDGEEPDGEPLNTDDESNEIPSFEFLFFIGVLFFVFLLKRKKYP